jgi:hypothetical protein
MAIHATQMAYISPLLASLDGVCLLKPLVFRNIDGDDEHAASYVIGMWRNNFFLSSKYGYFGTKSGCD